MPGLFVKQHAEAVSADNEIAVLYVHPCNVPSWDVVCQTVNKVFTVVVYYPAVQNSFTGAGLKKAFLFLKAHFIGYKSVKLNFGKPDLVHVNILTRCGVVALIGKLCCSIPYVITEHWSRYLPVRNSYRGVFRKMMTKLVVWQSKGIVTVSQALRKAMIQCGLNHRHFIVIHNSVNTSAFFPSEAALSSGKKVISHISCFDNDAKNITGMIRAVDNLKNLRTDFIFQLVGDGPDRRMAEELSGSLGLTGEFILFKGLVEGDNLVKVYQESLFTVLFSNYENMPVVVAESFACGVPVISTRVGGLPEIVNQSNGLLVEVGDEEALTRAMNQMLNTCMQYSKQVISQTAEQKFSLDVFRNAYGEFYHRIASTPFW